MMSRNRVLVVGIVLALLIGFWGVRSVMSMFEKAMDVGEGIIIQDDSYSKIEVISSNSQVEVIPTKSKDTTVSYEGKTKSSLKFKAAVKKDTLKVSLKEKQLFFNIGISKDKKITVQVPEKEYEKLSVKTDNGKIQVSKMHIDNLVLVTDNGKIVLEEIVGKMADLDTDNGKIIITDADLAINAITDNGAITYNADELKHPVSLKTDNGPIIVTLTKEPTNAVIEAKTDNGKVRIFGESRKQATYGTGEHLLKLRTDNGAITVGK